MYHSSSSGLVSHLNLTYLISDDYDQLHVNEFELITFKTGFILDLATAACVSKIHTLNVNRIQSEQFVNIKVSWAFAGIS